MGQPLMQLSPSHIMKQIYKLSGQGGLDLLMPANISKPNDEEGVKYFLRRLASGFQSHHKSIYMFAS